MTSFDPPDFELLRPLFELALRDDRADADVTTRTLVPNSSERRVGRILARQRGVASGIPLLAPLFRMRDAGAQVDPYVGDGDHFGDGDVLADVSADVHTLLAVERTALDMLQRLGGIATFTSELVARLAESGVELADTRKTTPGWRRLEKYAVRCGGGTNHRHDLADAAMVKDNHLTARAGERSPAGLRACVRQLRHVLPPGARFYVEVRSHAELEAVLQEGAPAIQLDGFDAQALRDAVAWVRLQPFPHPLLEATGSVDPDDIETIAAAGVTRISVDALTTRAPAVDLRMALVP